MCDFPPACSSPLVTENLPVRMYTVLQSLTTQSVRYHKLPRPATSQAKLHGVLGQKSTYGVDTERFLKTELFAMSYEEGTSTIILLQI
jgi:hypothetical protein